MNWENISGILESEIEKMIDVHIKTEPELKLTRNEIHLRIREIHEETENIWNEIIKNFSPDNKIKYLLIGEAPPWKNPHEKISYFYYEKSERTTLLNLFFRCFSGIEDIKNIKNEDKIDFLNNNGFLLIDFLPVSFNYSYLKNSKDKKIYKNLLKNSISFFNYKLSLINNYLDNDSVILISYSRLHENIHTNFNYDDFIINYFFGEECLNSKKFGRVNTYGSLYKENIINGFGI